MAISSYLPDVPGGVVVAAAFEDEARASAAVDLLRSSGVRMQDVSVVAASARAALRVAGDGAWSPYRRRRRLFGVLPVPARPPREVSRRFNDALRAGAIVVAVATDGQPADTIAALFAQARGVGVARWWQMPGDLFAPPELAGPY